MAMQMKTTTTYSVICDLCRNATESYTLKRLAREAAEIQGFHHLQWDTGLGFASVDLCSDCYKSDDPIVQAYRIRAGEKIKKEAGL